MVVQLPLVADARSVIKAFQETGPDSDVVAKRRVKAADLTGGRFQSALTERLTDKQHAVLEAVYHAGYFERPRTSTGVEIVDTLGVSPSTFHQHLHVAMRKLAEVLFAK